MPRASGSSKRQSAAAVQRDNKHDNGLVSPGKRVSGKKSHSQLNGSARSADHAVGAGQAGPVSNNSSQPVSNNSSSNSHQAPATNGNRTHKHGQVFAGVDPRADDEHRRASVGGYSEASSTDSAGTPACGAGNNGLVISGHRQIDVNAMKNTDVHRDLGPLELAATVLRSLPIQDTLAILIILMHVPSMSLSIIYAIFTFLTFVPPVTTSSGININIAEIFDGNSTMPSLFTVLCMDMFFLLMWLFLWQPIQEIILDFAKPVIAITLGGGTSARDGTSRGVTTCFTWVLLHHLIRGTRSQWSRLANHIPEEWALPNHFKDVLGTMSSSYDKRNAYGWVRSVLAIHILTQGLVRYVREWYLKREKISSLSNSNDPEAAKSHPGVQETSGDLGAGPSDADVGVLPPPISTSKKRRKQSAQVRLQQPLWAALASTKIVVMKEYELSHEAAETAGSNATDIHNLGNAPFDSQPCQIWISYIGSDEVCFSTSHFPDVDEEPTKANGHTGPPSGVDTSKPFYVRVNNAYWRPTRIFPVKDTEDHGGFTRWTGDIYGLRPASKYVCEFVDCRTEEVLFSSSIRTVQEPLRETDLPAPAIGDENQPLRPDSPATTLKTSINANEAKLADEKNRLKTLRKELKTRINAVKRDSELADSQLASSGSHDEKHKQKVRQQETQKAQAERDIESILDQINNFDTAPELQDRKKKMEKGYAAEKGQFDSAQKDFKDYKHRLEKDVKSKEVESSNLSSRRNKIATRIAKVENELANITDANNRGLDEAERRNQERSVWLEYASNVENNYNERLTRAREANGAKSDNIRSAQTQLASFHDYLNSANGMPPDADAQQHPNPFRSGSTWNPNPAAAPHFPVGMWPGSSTDLVGGSSSAAAPGATTSTAGGRGSGSWLPPPTAPAFEPRGMKSRGRSSSMLSDVSGFTQPSDEDEEFYGIPDTTSSPVGAQRVQQIWTNRLAGQGSSGSSGSGSGSAEDPSSPRA